MLGAAMINRTSYRRILLAGAALAAASLGAGAAVAQDATSVEELVVTAPNYVPTTNTSATKIDIPLIETPQSITVVTRDQMDILNMQNLQEAVRYTSGVIGENYGPDERYDWLTIRGFQPVQYIDGLQAPVGSTTNVGLDLWGAQSVEVLKGPAGVLYGSTPPGGIVNITTRRPMDELGGEFDLQYGSFDHKQIAGDITGPVGNGSVQLRLTALWRDRETQTDYVRSRRAYIAPALNWDITPSTSLTLLAYYQDDEVLGDGGGFLPAQGTILPNPNGEIPVNRNVGEPDYNQFLREQYGIGYEFGHKFNEHVTIRQNLKYSQVDNHFQSVYGAGLQADLRTLNRNNFIFPEFVRVFAVDTRAELRGVTGAIEHTGLVGVDYRDLKNDTDFGFGAGPTLDIFNPVYGAPVPAPSFSFAYIRQEQRQLGVYAQDQMALGGWRLTLSGRQDWLNTSNFNVDGPDDKAFTYRAGLNYISESGLAPYIAYATSFLPVSGADFFGVPFDPTTGEQIEAGIKYEPRISRDVKLFATGAVYALTQKNVLTNDPAHLFFSVQQGEVEVKGLELEAVARIRERLSFNASYSYTDSEVTKSNGADLGKQLPIVARHKASAFADYTFQDGAFAGLGAGVGVRYLGEAFGDPANTLKSDPETLFDALVHYDYRKWRVSLNASNVFDKIYIQRCADLTQCFYGNRRNVVLSVGRSF